MLFAAVLVKRREVPRECNKVNADAKKENCKSVLSGQCVKYFFTYATARRIAYCEPRGKESVYRKISPFTRQILEIRYLDVHWVLIMMDCTSVARIQINLACLL
jgi:hypothetical protein